MLLSGVGTLRYALILSETLLVKCPSVQWKPDGLTIHTRKWLLGAGFLGAPPISLVEGGQGPPTPNRAPDNQFRRMVRFTNLYQKHQFTRFLGVGSGVPSPLVIEGGRGVGSRTGPDHRGCKRGRISRDR